MRKAFAALLLIAASGAAAAEQCAVPPGLQPAPALGQEEQRLLPVTKMVLAYYWWPEQCQRPDSTQTPGCQAGFGFKVHGLWPDGAGKTYPQFCRAPTQLDAATVRAHYCMTPSTSLLQHEWVKHGTCHWPSPAAYFGDAERVAARISMPDVSKLPPDGLTAGQIRDAVVTANPQLPRQSLFVATNNKQWLTEVRVCLALDLTPQPCEAGDIGAPDRVPLRVRPR
jgi:ribonuclease T2